MRGLYPRRQTPHPPSLRSGTLSHKGRGQAKRRWPAQQNPLMQAPVLPPPRGPRLKPDNDPSPAPFGALAPNTAQAAIIALAQRTGLKRGAFRPMLSRLLDLLRAGPLDVNYQGASFRLYHQGSATERGALL